MFIKIAKNFWLFFFKLKGHTTIWREVVNIEMTGTGSKLYKKNFRDDRVMWACQITDMPACLFGQIGRSFPEQSIAGAHPAHSAGSQTGTWDPAHWL